MCRVVIVHDRRDTAHAVQLAADLSLRGFTVAVAELGTEAATPRSGNGAAIVVLIPAGRRTTRAWESAAKSLKTTSKGGRMIVVAPGDVDLPSWMHGGTVRAIIRRDAVSYERTFEQLLIELVAPLPHGVQLRARPSYLTAPTGLGFWSDDLFVLDDARNALVRVGTNRTALVYHGLSDPHHLALDRDSKALIANRGDDEVLVATLGGSGIRGVRTLTKVRGRRLSKPTGVAFGDGLAAVCDTDAHRVLVTTDDVWRAVEPNRADWQELKGPSLRYPCAVHIGFGFIFAASTLSDEVHCWTMDRVYVGEVGASEGSRPRCPTGLATVRVKSGTYLLIVEADGGCLRVVPFQPGGRTFAAARHLQVDLGSKHANLLAVATNRVGTVAITDRRLRAVWLLDLDEYMEANRDAP